MFNGMISIVRHQVLEGESSQAELQPLHAFITHITHKDVPSHLSRSSVRVV